MRGGTELWPQGHHHPGHDIAVGPCVNLQILHIFETAHKLRLFFVAFFPLRFFIHGAPPRFSPFLQQQYTCRPTRLDSRQVLAVLVAENVLVSARPGGAPSAAGVDVLHNRTGRQVLLRHL